MNKFHQLLKLTKFGVSPQMYHASKGTPVPSPSNIIIHPKVKKALSQNDPVVALESAILTHGMQYPFNLQTALDVESIIRKEGAVPATIGIIQGKIYVGLTEDQLEFLAKCEANCIKVSRRDLPYILTKHLHGGTTVSGTMVLSNLVGIPVFVTGGIGGVHRHGETTFDISADLTELGRTPVAVVSAGVKSILDVGKTLEYLETQGVCVSVVGQSTAFPDFFTAESGFDAPCNVQNCTEAAQIIHERALLNLQSGILFAVPIPKYDEADGQAIKEAIDCALSEARNKVKGRDITPFVLKRVAEITEGKSVLTNMALIKNNARIGAQISVEYSKIVNHNRTATGDDGTEAEPVVIGGSIVDLVVKIQETQIEFNGRTHKGRLSQSYGGVGRNIADALTRLGAQPLFISAVGQDDSAASLLRHNPQMDRRGILRDPTKGTASYSAILDCRGEVLIGVGDMEVHETISTKWVNEFKTEIQSAPLVVLDGNVPQATMEKVFEICDTSNTPVWYEPTDVHKAVKPWKVHLPNSEVFASPNLNEFNAIITYFSKGTFRALLPSETHLPEKVLLACRNYWSSFRGLMVTLGMNGFLIIRRGCMNENEPLLPPNAISATEIKDNTLIGIHFTVPHPPQITSVSGAGDCLAAGFILGMVNRKKVSECAALGLDCANLSLQYSEAVPESVKTVSCTKGLPYTIIGKAK